MPRRTMSPKITTTATITTKMITPVPWENVKVSWQGEAHSRRLAERRHPPGRALSRRSACQACTSTIMPPYGNQFAAQSNAALRDLKGEQGKDDGDEDGSAAILVPAG